MGSKLGLSSGGSRRIHESCLMDWRLALIAADSSAGQGDSVSRLITPISHVKNSGRTSYLPTYAVPLTLQVRGLRNSLNTGLRIPPHKSLIRTLIIRLSFLHKAHARLLQQFEALQSSKLEASSPNPLPQTLNPKCKSSTLMKPNTHPQPEPKAVNPKRPHGLGFRV